VAPPLSFPGARFPCHSRGPAAQSTANSGFIRVVEGLTRDRDEATCHPRHGPNVSYPRDSFALIVRVPAMGCPLVKLDSAET